MPAGADCALLLEQRRRVEPRRVPTAYCPRAVTEVDIACEVGGSREV
jgi:hypothetical protein